jgi:hypothetical protein
VHDCATHNDDRTHAISERWIKAQGKSKVGKWPNGDEVDFTRALSRDAQHLLHSTLASWSAAWCRLVRVAKPVSAVHPLCRRKRLRHWTSRADRDGHVVEATELQETACILGSKVRWDVAVDTPNSHDVGIAPSGKVEHRDGVVNTNIGVQEDLVAVHERAMIDRRRARWSVVLHC